jgi:hypothetical protein
VDVPLPRRRTVEQAPERHQPLGRRGQFPIEASAGLAARQASEQYDDPVVQVRSKTPDTALGRSA